MQTISLNKLKQRIQKKGISTLALEREAGLKRNAIHNILQGKSRKPHDETIKAICNILECSPEDILVTYSDIDISKYFNMDNIVNRKLFVNCSSSVSEVLDDIGVELKFRQYLSLINDVYDYSFSNNLGDYVDKNFVNWYVKKNLNIS